MPQKFIGFSESAKQYNCLYGISDTIPGISKIQNALVAGVRPTVPGRKLDMLAGGVFDASGHLVEASLQPRSDEHNAIAPIQPPERRTPQRTIEKAIFGGVAFDHFGHFLLESTARLWALSEYKDYSWIFLTTGQEKLPDYQVGFLEILGLNKEKIIVVGDLISVNELFIPHTSFTYHHYASSAYRDTFRRAQIPDSGRAQRRIFISRKNMKIAMTIGESDLENVLSDDGWEIVYPELLSPLEQVQIFHEDNIILGLQGSAMHLSLFAPPGRKVIHLCRGQGYRGYYLLDDLMDADAIYFDSMVKTELPSKPIAGPFLLDIGAALSFLFEQGLIKKNLSSSINAYENSKKRLLEYEAWWHYTESQIRQHHNQTHEGLPANLEMAIDSAEKAVKLYDGSTEIISHAAALALKQGSSKRALSILDGVDLTCFSDDKDKAILFYFRSLTEEQMEQYDLSLSAVQEARRFDDKNPLYANQEAKILYRLNRYSESERCLYKIIDNNMQTYETYYILSIILSETKRNKEAVNLSVMAFNLNNTDIGIYRRALYLLMEEGRFEDARNIGRQFCEINPIREDIIEELLSIEDELGDVDEKYTILYLEKLYTINPYKLPIYNRLYDIYKKNNTIPRIDGNSKFISAGVSDYAIMLYDYSQQMISKGKDLDAIFSATEAVNLDPNNETILLYLVGLHIKCGNILIANVLSSKLVEMYPSSGFYYYVLSLSEFKIGQEKKSIKSAKMAKDILPENEVIKNHYDEIIKIVGDN
ncbi:glycosyltransferase 61 family protein [Neokomagataea thailandica]|uniref:Glycosyltransferase 61 catalytic domain-containing protein n=1 Tax=Neokomagataea tanensis NBRC 106556 TaxID=1223519 RepID=A0ABQ0QIL1_9PROT|nr:MULTISPECIES: glycosyltransferase 61 family protein [Neokomagataea]GBR45988.1 hypothetical protein AA106556_0957 [Neokomagataea tanensis NBRC 106556]